MGSKLLHAMFTSYFCLSFLPLQSETRSDDSLHVATTCWVENLTKFRESKFPIEVGCLYSFDTEVLALLFVGSVCHHSFISTNKKLITMTVF